MKRNYHSNLLYALVAASAVLLLVNSTADAQSAQARFRFMNATSDPVVISIDGAKLRPEPFQSGESTGVIGILAGTHKIIASTMNARQTEGTINVQQQTSVDVICYFATTIEPQTGKAVRALQILSHNKLPHQPGKHFQVLYVSSQLSTEVLLNGQAATLPALREVKLDNVPGSMVKIEQNGRGVLTYAATEPGNCLLVLFDQADGSLKGGVLRDYS